MSHPHYYASTSRNLDRVLQYGVFPFAYMLGLLWCRDDARATQVARFSGAAASALLTSAFLGLESHTLDNVVREAVTAEMGIDADKFKPSDCKYSKNIIAQEGYNDFIALQPKRYLKDLLFLAPSLVEAIYTNRTGKKFLPVRAEVEAAFDVRKGGKVGSTKYNGWDIIANGHLGWDMAVYAGISSYWAYETFGIEKNSYYPIAQDLVGKIKPTEGNIITNHLLEIYQRARNDQKLSMIKTDDAEAYAALNQLFTIMVNAYNKHDGRMDIPEIVYLIGLNKINIHAADGKTVSKEAVEQSEREIERVLTIGLDGIRAENKKRRETEAPIADHSTSTAHVRSYTSRPNFVNPEYRSRTFVDRFTDGAIKTSQSVLGSIGMLPRRPESYISTADPTELIGTDGGFGR